MASEWSKNKLPKAKKGKAILCEDEDGDQFVAKGKETNNGFATKIEWKNGYIEDIEKVTKKWKSQ